MFSINNHVNLSVDGADEALEAMDKIRSAAIELENMLADLKEKMEKINLSTKWVNHEGDCQESDETP